MSKANPLEDKSKTELEKMEKEKKKIRSEHMRHANRLAKEIAAIKREIENKELKEQIAALKKQSGAAKPAPKK